MRSFDDFQGLLTDARAESEAGRPPMPADKQRLFSALSYQPPSDIPGGLAALTELFNIDPDDVMAQYDEHIAETARQRAMPRPAPVAHKVKCGAFENRSDAGNASRLVEKFHHLLRFCPDTNRWLIWDGARWAVDEVGAIYQYAMATVQDIYREVAALSDPAERKHHASFALRSESKHGIEAMISLARHEPGIPVRRSQLDAHPMLLNAANGIIDLQAGELLEHSQEMMFTKIIPWEIDSEMPTPCWDKFLGEITGQDAGLQAYLQQIAGYCLTASTREQCFFIFWGDGRNGKSTFIKVLLDMMDGWAAQTPAETLMVKKNNNNSDLARLADKRLVAAIETEEGGRLAEGMVKALSGSDRIAARALYENYFEYDPKFKIILTTNHKPRIKGTDFAIWRRINLVPFTWRIPDKQVDMDLPDKLRAEMPGILAWAVKGCMAWQQAGKLESPDKVVEAVKEYRQDQDVVQKFIDESCDVDKVYSDSLKDIFGEYEKWSKDNGEYFLSKSRFSRRLVDMGFSREHTKTGARFKGIKVRGEELF